MEHNPLTELQGPYILETVVTPRNAHIHVMASFGVSMPHLESD